MTEESQHFDVHGLTIIHRQIERFKNSRYQATLIVNAIKKKSVVEYCPLLPD
jgi:hypothetical protein